MLKHKLTWILSGLLFGTLFAIGFQFFTPRTISQAHPQAAVARFPSQATLPQTTAPTSETEQILKVVEDFQKVAYTRFVTSKQKYYYAPLYSLSHIYKATFFAENGAEMSNDQYTQSWYVLSEEGQVLDAVSLNTNADGEILQTQYLKDGKTWMDYDTGKVTQQLVEPLYLTPNDYWLKLYYQFPGGFQLQYSPKWVNDEKYTVIVYVSEYPQEAAQLNTQPDLNVTEKVVTVEYEVFYNKETGIVEKVNSYFGLADGTKLLSTESAGFIQPVSELPANIVEIMEWAKSE
jgi:hypothetical protein